MSVEVNSEKLDQVKQSIVDGVKRELIVNNDVDSNLVEGNVSIISSILRGQDHIAIDCQVVLTKEAINNYGKPAPVEVNNTKENTEDAKSTKKTHTKTAK